MYIFLFVSETHTVELQWLEQLWSHVNVFVRANDCESQRQIRRHNRDFFRFSLIANTRSMLALLYQFWSYILRPEKAW